jgi:hypothetical protein
MQAYSASLLVSAELVAAHRTGKIRGWNRTIRREVRPQLFRRIWLTNMLVAAGFLMLALCAYFNVI